MGKNKELKIVKRVAVATSLGFILGILCFVYVGIIDGFGGSITWGVLLWYTFIGFIIGLIGTIDKHPIFGFHVIYLRGILIAGILDLSLGLMAQNEFTHLFSFLPFPIEYACLLEGIVVGVIIDGIATKIGGEGKGLLETM